MAEKRDAVEDLTLGAAESHLKDLADEIRRVGEKEKLSEEDETYLEELTARFDEVDAHRKEIRRKQLVERVSAATSRPLTATPGHTAKGLDDDPFGEPESISDPKRFKNPWNLDEVRRIGPESELNAELRSRALSAIEQMSGTNDKRRETMTQIIEGAGRGFSVHGDTTKLAKQLLVTSSPDYLRAFQKASTGKADRMTDAERRAMSLTDTAGGFLVPFQLDPTVIITSDGSFNQIRQISRKVVATGDTWNGVSSGHVSWSWDGEATEVSDDATTFAQPSITIYKARGFVPISEEALADESNVASEVGRLLMSGKEELEAVAFATGSGSQPQGIVTALQGVAGSVVSATTNNAFVAADVYKLDEELPARYRFRASWLANRAIYNDIRQFDTSGGGALWERLGADVPPQLIGKNAYEAEGMDGAIATGDDYVLVFGDFDNYVIADRIGTTIRFIPDLFHTTTNLPSGQSGWYAYYRVGADSVNDGAFRLLKV